MLYFPMTAFEKITNSSKSVVSKLKLTYRGKVDSTRHIYSMLPYKEISCRQVKMDALKFTQLVAVSWDSFQFG